MANAFMPNSFEDKTDDVLIVPVFGLNYNYQINTHYLIKIMVQKRKVV